jgi:hypothetical protein
MRARKGSLTSAVSENISTWDCSTNNDKHYMKAPFNH